MEPPDLASRAFSILRRLGLPAASLQPVESFSHAVWLTEGHAVHYHVIGSVGRLEHEARVGRRMPPEALYPRVVAVGRDGNHDWLVTERAPGIPVAEAWPSMNGEERRRAVCQAAAALRAVHHSPVTVLVPPCLQGDAPTITRRAFLELLISRDIVEGSSFLSAFDDTPRVMAHGDFNFNQLLWHEGRVTALLDLEMSHTEAPDWDLGPFLGFCADPVRAVAEQIESIQNPEDYREAPQWLREAYPEMFDYPRLRERLLVQSLVFRAGELLSHPDQADRIISESLAEARHVEPLLDF